MSACAIRECPLALPADDGLTLAGTLTLPAGAGPFPAAVILPGSGPVDRESNAAVAGRRMRLELGRPLARELAARGIASYRYDRRGVGETGGGDWRRVGFTQNRDDAAAVLRGFRQHPKVRADALAIVGHSEGALHATALAAAGQTAAVVLLAGTARPGADVLRYQLGAVSADIPAPVRFLFRLLRTSVAEQQAQSLAKITATTDDVVRIRGARVNARWMREFLVYDPRRDLVMIQVPVLAITGAKDLQVDPADLEVIAELVPGPVDTHCIPDLTHILRRDPGPASLRHYRRLLREPVDAQLLIDVADWLSRTLSAR